MPDRFRNHTDGEKTAALAVLKELVTHPGVIPPLLKGDVEQLVSMLPADFFVTCARLQLREAVTKRRSSILSEHTTSAAKKLAERSFPLTEDDRRDLAFLCYVNPALWYRTVLEIQKVSPADAATLAGSPSAPFRRC